MRAQTLAVAAGCALSAASAQAQFLNPDFEIGNTAGWVVANTTGGTGAPGSVTMVDIDGPGPLGPTFAATFSVGRSSATQPGEQGIEMTQAMVLNGGQLYTFEFDWAARRSPTGGSNAQGGVFSLIVNGAIIATQSAGTTSGTTARYGHLSTPFTPATTGSYNVGVRITRPFTVPADLFQHVDNFRPAAGGVTGACCLPSGACTVTSAALCALQTGIYRGDGTTCPANCPQPPTGACCLPNLTCVITWQGGCTAQGGTYRGDNSVCAGNCPEAWQEQGDAGDLPATAQSINGSGDLPAIVGTVTDSDSDMYRLRICDAAAFSATTVGGAAWDTQLSLFDSTGHGVAFNDDSTGLQSTLTTQFIPGTGEYFLAIAGYDRDPFGETSSGEIWNDEPFGQERRPDGPAAAEAIGSWGDTGDFGAYTIRLDGACYISQGPICYPDCDGSHALNVNDFVCFQAAFAANAPYADCDHNSQQNVNDFICFQAAFAAGCSQL